jgi:hypothetical protein
MDEIRSILIPVRIYSEANIRCHWAIKNRRKKAMSLGDKEQAEESDSKSNTGSLESCWI